MLLDIRDKRIGCSVRIGHMTCVLCVSVCVDHACLMNHTGASRILRLLVNRRANQAKAASDRVER